VRLLPQLTPVNEWFWNAGADGRLRIQGCRDVVTSGGGTPSGVLLRRDGA
jgi:hypothetical protein